MTEPEQIKVPHEWRRDSVELVRGTFIYIKRCANCGVGISVPKEEREALPPLPTPHK